MTTANEMVCRLLENLPDNASLDGEWGVVMGLRPIV
jgi:hypothetical protein